MTENLRTERLVTKTAIFRRSGFVGEIIEEPRMKPRVTVTVGDRTIVGGKHLSATELEILASIFQGMHDEVAFKAEAEPAQ